MQECNYHHRKQLQKKPNGSEQSKIRKMHFEYMEIWLKLSNLYHA